METKAWTRGDSGHRHRVLVVEDFRDLAEVTAMLFEDAGHVACVARNASDALLLAVEFQPDVCLLDIEIPPGISGHELAARLRLIPGLANCRMLAVTSDHGSASRARSKASGFERHMMKPTTARQLNDAVCHEFDLFDDTLRLPRAS